MEVVHEGKLRTPATIEQIRHLFLFTAIIIGHRSMTYRLCEHQVGQEILHLPDSITG